MPYLNTKDRWAMDQGEPCDTPGELNYKFTRLCQQYIKDKGEKYQYYNDIIGALEACKLELYRRAVSTYEDTKVNENGDVF